MSTTTAVIERTPGCHAACLDITTNPRVTVLRVGGEVDVASAAELRDCLHQVIHARPGRLVVDLGQVGFIDSVGLGVLVAAHRRLGSLGAGSVMQVVCADGLTQRTLRVTGLDRAFPVHPTVAQALADLPCPEPAY